MTKRYVHGILGALVAAALVSSCGEDRSGEYYALITTQTWMYETMQQEYLYYQDMPEENKLDFFKKPSEFLSSVVSQKDKKSGSTFSHIDSVYVTSRAASQTPTFGFEGSMVRASNGSYGIRVLYVQENSPAKEVGLERGSLIIAANNKKSTAQTCFISQLRKKHICLLWENSMKPDLTHYRQYKCRHRELWKTKTYINGIYSR